MILSQDEIGAPDRARPRSAGDGAGSPDILERERQPSGELRECSSSPGNYKRSTWRPDRLADAMKGRGLVNANGEPDPAGLRLLLNRLRSERGQSPVCLNTIRNWLKGSSSPVMGRTGHEPSVFEIADALQLSLDWLCGRTDRQTGES
jgi:hypothetical protein